MWKYWGQVMSTAAKQSFSSSVGGRSGTAMIVACALTPLGIRLATGGQEPIQWGSEIVFAFLGSVVGYILVLLGFMIREPWDLHRKLSDRVASLESQVAPSLKILKGIYCHEDLRDRYYIAYVENQSLLEASVSIKINGSVVPPHELHRHHSVSIPGKQSIPVAILRLEKHRAREIKTHIRCGNTDICECMVGEFQFRLVVFSTNAPTVQQEFKATVTGFDAKIVAID